MISLLKTIVYICAALAGAACMAKEPGLQVVAIVGDQMLPVYGMSDGKVVARDAAGSLIPIRHGQVQLAGGDGPSLATGFSPAYYIVNRTSADYHAKPAQDGLPHAYSLEIAAVWTGEKEEFWGEVDLSKIWPRESLDDPDSLLVVGWWQPGIGWRRSVAANPLFKDEQPRPMSITLREAELSGQPHVLLLSKGKLVPPAGYSSKVAGTVVAALHDNQAPTDAQLLLDAAKATDPMGLTWLHYAAAWGRADWLRKWNEIRGKEKVRVPPRTVAPLSLAAMHGHAGVIKDLVEAGAGMETMDEFGYDPCHFAVLYGHRGVVAAMLDLGYNPNNEAMDGIQRPLGLAYEFGFDDIFTLVRERGGRFSNFNMQMSNALLLDAAYKGHAGIIAFLISKGADPNAEGLNGWRALSLAVRSGNPDAVRVLLSSGADPDTISGTGYPVLGDAVGLGELGLIKILLEHGAKTQPTGKMSLGYVELATMIGDREIVRELMQAGAECTFTPDVAQDILLLAVSSDIPEMVELAFGKCVDPGFLFNGTFPMDWVVQYYGAEKTRQWWESSGYASPHPTPEFATVAQLDASPKAVSCPLQEYDKDLFKRFGPIKTLVQAVIDADGLLLFPKFEESLPRPLRLTLLGSVSKWRFEPPTVAGRPARIKVGIPVTLDRPQDRLDASELDPASKPPRPLEQPVHYPAALIKQRVNGVVHLFYVVDETGVPRNPKVLRTTHPLLANACLKALPYWKFEPATRDGKPVAKMVRQVFVMTQ